MTDDRWEPLDRLAARAPSPPPGLADVVVARARRRRSAVAAIVASTTTVLALVIGAVVWTGSSGDTLTAPSSSASSPPEVTTEPTSPSAPRPGGRLAMVATAVERTLRQLVEDPREILISGRLCADSGAVIFGERDEDCTRWDESSRDRLTSMLHDVAPVRFVPREFSDIARRRPLVSLAALSMRSPRRGSVYVFAINGGLSCTGSEQTLERSATGWKVVPTRSGVSSMVVC